MNAIGQLRQRIAAEGRPLVDGLVDAPAQTVFAELVAAGERTRGDSERYALALESALEGYLVHFGEARVISPTDFDMRLLAGDFLYALGFLELASLGDAEAIEALAELISACAAVHSAQPDLSTQQTESLWGLAMLAIATGRWPALEPASEALRTRGVAAATVAPKAVHERAVATGLELEIEAALIAFRVAASSRSSTT